MAYSPSPGPSTFTAPFVGARRRSATPPLAQQSLSKRDKRRIAIETRLKDISTSFASNRDAHLRSQLNALSKDIVFIGKADLYQNGVLDDGIDSAGDASSIIASSADTESRVILGKYALRFVNDINDAMEERDAGLTNVHLQFTKQLAHLRMEYDFAVEVAGVEEQALKDTARSRMISNVHNKKRMLHKEKDSLDSADSSALLHSSGFAIAQPASPGGTHSNRKTRHTRHHRQDPDGLESIDGNKRKRKVPPDLDNDSPGPGARNFFDTPGLLLDKGRTISDHDQIESPSIERHFTSRELGSHHRIAHTQVAQSWAERRPRANAGNSKSGNYMAHAFDYDMQGIESRSRGGPAKFNSHSEDEREQEDVGNLVAPAMDRAMNHSTRSTRNNNIDSIIARDAMDGPDDPQRVYGIAVLDANAIRLRATGSRDIEATLTSSLSTQEITEDMAFFQQALTDDSY